MEILPIYSKHWQSEVSECHGWSQTGFGLARQKRCDWGGCFFFLKRWNFGQNKEEKGVKTTTQLGARSKWGNFADQSVLRRHLHVLAVELWCFWRSSSPAFSKGQCPRLRSDSKWTNRCPAHGWVASGSLQKDPNSSMCDHLPTQPTARSAPSELTNPKRSGCFLDLLWFGSQYLSAERLGR